MTSKLLIRNAVSKSAIYCKVILNTHWKTFRSSQATTDDTTTTAGELPLNVNFQEI